jgi:hypothetical protein
MKRAMKRSPLPVRPVAALLCLVLFLGLQVFAASSVLHKAIHHEAGTPDHHCVVTLLTQGHLGTTAVSLALAALFAALLYCLPSFEAAFARFSFHRLPPGRAPPPA